MSVDSIEERVRAILADVFGLETEAIGQETSAETVEGWDSLQQLTVVLALEEEFGIELDDEDTVTAVTFSSITAIVRDRLEMLEPS